MISVLIGLVELLVGVYGLAGVVKMRRGILTGGFIPQEAFRTPCSDPAALVRTLTPHQLIFSLACMVCGILTILDGQYGILGDTLRMILSLVLILIALGFSAQIRAATRKYFKT